MKTNELRIGNFVATEGIDFVEVSKIDADFGICYKIPQEFGQFYPYKEVEPIPLTEEWLMNLGFKKYTYWRPNNLDYYHSDLKEFCIISGQVRLYTDDPYEFFKIPQNIQFVHQLQNLYFALTGEELTIKE